MFTQLLHYVQDALNKGETVAPFLAVIDSVKTAIMKAADVIPFLEQKTIQWRKSAIDYILYALNAGWTWTEVEQKDRLAQERKKKTRKKHELPQAGKKVLDMTWLSTCDRCHKKWL